VKTLIQLTVVGIMALVVAYLHPFHLVMPWQSGSATEVNDTMLAIMGPTPFTLIDADVDRATPFSYRAATGVYEGDDDPAMACSTLRLALDDWGMVTDIERRDDGCDIEASGPGPMVTSIELTENPDVRRALTIDVRVEHRS